MSDYFGLSVDELLDEVADDRAAPAAGAAAAVVAALAASITQLAARSSAEDWEDARACAAQAASLRQKLSPLAQEDAEAYAAARAALRERGDDGLAEALERAADVPLAIAEAAVDVAALAAGVAEHGNPDLRADAAAAAVLAEAAVRATAKLVEVNLTIHPEDDRITQARMLAIEASKSCERAAAAVA
jgi:formiminotetrahydrofolate cyclodeaminase